MGLETREIWHNTDWEKLKNDPQVVSMPTPGWLFAHSPQHYAYEEFDLAAFAVEQGAHYVPTNVPPPNVNHRLNDFKDKDAAKLFKGEAMLQAKI